MQHNVVGNEAMLHDNNKAPTAKHFGNPSQNYMQHPSVMNS